ncbi:protein-disulfide reductase DsbD [Polynucleobacter sp. MWH-CaK5]|nr:protein-disulfide reductase DsbD [Polynucleobacter sp. MWH-CaK5]
MIKNLLISFALMFSAITAQAQNFLAPEQAFQVSAEYQSKDEIVLNVKPAKGYYIYRESIKFKLVKNNGDLSLGPSQLPQGKIKFDENFGKELETYPKDFSILLPLINNKDASGMILSMELQGCADKGICYPPMELRFTLSGLQSVVNGVLYEEGAEAESGAQNTTKQLGLSDLWSARDDAGLLTGMLQNISPIILLGSFFILGLAMALTPCVLPMLPIMSSVIFGSKTNQHRDVSKLRSSVLAMSYVLGMAIMYSVAGMITAALGANIQAWLQNPWVLSVFALMLLALAASLFGFYELRLPQSLHNKIDRIAGKQEGGSVVGAFMLGAISTLIASPCVTAPLAGVLAFIAQTGSIPMGGVLLFVMALGMGLPLMLFAIGAKGIIPRAGAWMTVVQRIFGVLLIGLAVWVASPIFTSSKSSSNETMHRLESGIVFQRVANTAQLDALLNQAKQKGQPVLLDFYADWCVTCKEMELLTFSDEKVKAALGAYLLIQVDVTKNTVDHQRILKQYALFGPPAILFFDANGEEKISRRVIGFMKAERFLERLQ